MTPFTLSLGKGVMSLALCMFAVAVEGLLDARFILEVVTLLVGLISTAAIMRYQVTGLSQKVGEVEKWQKDHEDEATDYKESHVELHRQLAADTARIHLDFTESNARLTQIMLDQQRRITELEAARWREMTAGR